MDQKKKIGHFDKNFDKLGQQLDFTTLQTAFLAIFFAIFIFITGIILYHKEEDILIWLIALGIFPYNLIMLVNLIDSIISSKAEDKFRSFKAVLYLLVWSGAVTFVILIFIGINLLLESDIVVNNYIVVIIFLSVVSIAHFSSRYIEKKFAERFNLIFEDIKVEKERYVGRLKSVMKFYNNNRKLISNSVKVGILTSILSGLLETPFLKSIGEIHYGLPYDWIIVQINEKISVEYNYYSLFSNLVIHTIIILIILLIIKQIYKLICPYFSKFNKTKKYSQKKNKKIEKWKDDPAFVKTNKSSKK